MYEGLKGCSKRYCKIMLDVTEEIIIFFDIRGTVIGCNNSANTKLGYTSKDIVGLFIGDIFSDAFYLNDYGNVILPNESGDERITGVMYRQNKTCFDVQANVKSWHDEMGDFVGVLCAT